MKLTEKLLLINELEEEMGAMQLSSDVIFTKVTETAKLVTSSDRSSLFIYNNDSKQLETQVAEGLLTRIFVNVGEGLVGQCAQLQEIIVENDVDTSKSFNSEIDLGSGYVTRNTLVVPILDRQKNLWGVIQVLNKSESNYDITDEELLHALSKNISQYFVK